MSNPSYRSLEIIKMVYFPNAYRRDLKEKGIIHPQKGTGCLDDILRNMKKAIDKIEIKTDKHRL